MKRHFRIEYNPRASSLACPYHLGELVEGGRIIWSKIFGSLSAAEDYIFSAFPKDKITVTVS